MSDIIEVPAGTPNLTLVTKQDVEGLKSQRDLLRSFVQSQMKEAQFSNPYESDYGDGDYGIIPGTKKKALLKQGAEKLQRLFGLGARFTVVDKTVDAAANFAMYTYRCEVYSLRSGLVIATCDASANSQEVKFKERTVWRDTGKRNAQGNPAKESIKEATPVYDVLNTLMKMSQKRAFVGGTLLATGASEYFVPDMELDENPAQTKKDQGSSVPQSAHQAPSEPAQPTPKGTPEGAPVCCGRPMMVSKFPDRQTGEVPWYCLKCQGKRPRHDGNVA